MGDIDEHTLLYAGFMVIQHTKDMPSYNPDNQSPSEFDTEAENMPDSPSNVSGKSVGGSDIQPDVQGNDIQNIPTLPQSYPRHRPLPSTARIADCDSPVTVDHGLRPTDSVGEAEHSLCCCN
ncbi:hypothetical protein FE257_005035 [Aspergillus nanangensis]|uniref:Uncharacterized protein n=1 Tax=Aspergillus nanangensis TaxID=2582783 RepID=A0AAD4CR09_ASPNN|nr:hypothetical protein FE257_005035 [Aspergillus nanangensis]